jgi:hypothetical protein
LPLHSPSFHGNKREDVVIVQTANDQPLFAQLLCVLKISVLGNIYSVALVHKYDQRIPARERPRKDTDLSLLRVRARPRKLADFIFVDSIIRGAVLAEDYGAEHKDERFVIDAIDTDMFLRLLRFI